MGPGGSLKSGSPGITTGSGHESGKDLAAAGKEWFAGKKQRCFTDADSFFELEPNLAKTLSIADFVIFRFHLEIWITDRNLGAQRLQVYIYIGLLIIPIDEILFFRGVAQPPTR